MIKIMVASPLSNHHIVTISLFFGRVSITINNFPSLMGLPQIQNLIQELQHLNDKIRLTRPQVIVQTPSAQLQQA